MPAKSQAQAKAMFAAASGHSTLGIPKSVGQEFSSATHNVKDLPKRLSSLAQKRKKRKNGL